MEEGPFIYVVPKDFGYISDSQRVAPGPMEHKYHLRKLSNANSWAHSNLTESETLNVGLRIPVSEEAFLIILTCAFMFENIISYFWAMAGEAKGDQINEQRLIGKGCSRGKDPRNGEKTAEGKGP